MPNISNLWADPRVYDHGLLLPPFFWQVLSLARDRRTQAIAILCAIFGVIPLQSWLAKGSFSRSIDGALYRFLGECPSVTIPTGKDTCAFFCFERASRRNLPRNRCEYTYVKHALGLEFKFNTNTHTSQNRREFEMYLFLIFSKTPTGPPDPRSPKTPQQQKKKFQNPRKPRSPPKVNVRSPKVNVCSPKVNARSPKVNVKYFLGNI